MSKLVYLDLRDWIGLSRARLGRPGTADYADALEQLRSKVREDAVVLPLSFAHYTEMSHRIQNPSQRAEVALTMAELSRYIALTDRQVLLLDELTRSLATELGLDVVESRRPVTGFGFAHAFGQPPVVGRIVGEGVEEARAAAAEHAQAVIAGIEEGVGTGWRFRPSGKATDAFDLIEEAGNAAAQFITLRGPTDADLPAVQAYGYNPQSSRAVIERMHQREADLAIRLAEGTARRVRLDDIISARAMISDLGELWQKALAALRLPQKTMETLNGDAYRRILTNVPIIEVESAVRRGNFRNGSYRWSTNDIYDLSFLGAAVVYCHAVLTDKHNRMQLVSQGIDRKYETFMPRQVSEMTRWLRGTEG